MASQVGRVQLSLPTTAHFSAPEGNVTAEGGRNGHPAWESPIILANHSPFQCALRECYSSGGRNGHPGSESPIILANHSPFQCALRECYSGGGRNGHPGWESQIHVVSSKKTPGYRETRRKHVSSGLKS
ncbi:hypothetical protein AVEN_127321-1 [Araneus ventricosus]|uniref:Uncharacterized protein n=1 Tax=Araneus ventricosus TaxID=182803 RepID=A0A4Y2W1S9_ARAVE|nr:hypothetical protein AVEN_127321-1 [Araneus ventricosus]